MNPKKNESIIKTIKSKTKAKQMSQKGNIIFPHANNPKANPQSTPLYPPNPRLWF